MKNHSISHLIKSEDLNHHGTLYAGRSAEWMVEAAFVAAAAEHGKPQEIVFVNIHELNFKKPVPKGDIITVLSKIAKVGNTSITVYVRAVSEISKTSHMDGFLTFVCVETDTKRKKVHGIIMDEPADSEEKDIRKRASEL
ncbi:MAG: hotdog domain-containing protein [Syntrophomonadaceae bacterium]|nr:hotdog domain-containing protein [Syntrophomonadaceae bacterium]